MAASHEIALRMTFNTVQAEILLLWACNESHTTWTDVRTRKAMQELAEHLQYAASVQCPHIKIDKAFGDFS
jgi:hypothetical protein